MAKILICDDDGDLRDVYSEMLSEKHQVEQAKNGEEGLAKAQTGGYDLILLDVMMPKMTGVQFLKKRAENPTLKKIPVVMLTNMGQDDILKECFNLGIKYYVLKVQTTPDKVLGVVEKALKG